jgi:hypothetical protein
MASAIIPALITGASLLGSSYLSNKGSSSKLPTLTKPQQGLQSDILDRVKQLLEGQGSYGGAQNFLSQLLSGDQGLKSQMQAPYLRQFNEEILPGIARRYGGIGAQSSSAFQNELARAGTDLQERLAGLNINSQLQGAGLGLGSLLPLLQAALGPQFGYNIQQGSNALSQGFGGIGQGFGSFLGKNLLDSFNQPAQQNQGPERGVSFKELQQQINQQYPTVPVSQMPQVNFGRL